MPSWSKIFLKNSAARISLPGGFVVSIRRYSRCHCTARSAYCFRRSGGMLSEESPCLATAVCDHPSAVTMARTNPNKQTFRFLLGIQSPVIFKSLGTQFLYQLCQNYLGSGHYSPCLALRGLQCYCKSRG